MSVTIFNKRLTSSFQPSLALMLSASEVTLDFHLVVAAVAGTVQWYLEFSADPAGRWSREVAEEDVGLGVVKMPEVIRTFMDNNGATLAIGTHDLDVEFRRRQQFVRIQLRDTTGTTDATVVAPFGTLA
jgi:hypothetical protein